MRFENVFKTVLVLIILLSGYAYGAGSSATASAPVDMEDAWNNIFHRKVDWVADNANGTVPTATMTIDGYLMLCETSPGTTAPTTNYDITLVNSAGVDVMEGELANRSAVATERTSWSVRYVSGNVTFTLTNNSVNSATGTLDCLVYKED